VRRTILGIVAVAALAGCAKEGERAGSKSGSTDSVRALDAETIRRDLPHAGFIRLQQTKGQGLSREVWEVEILQADSDVWIKGTVRSSGRAVPFKEPMPLAEYHDLWTWIRGLELDKLVVHEDSSAAPGEWQKTLVVDIVESSNRRIRTKSTWARPLLGQPQIHELEKRMNDLLVRSSERELKRMAVEADSAAVARQKSTADSASAKAPQ
jgi:hypothetical protein